MAGTEWTTIAGFFAGGIASWTFAEYALHNWVGHLGKGRNGFSREHLKHHATTHYFSPWWMKTLAAVPVIGLAAALFGWLLGWVAGFAYTGGLALMYVAYEVVHRRAHTHPPRGPYSRWVRKNHFHHHFRNPNHNHGVTNPLFDLIFGTYDSTRGRIRVPRKHAMGWLVDADGEIRPEFAADYELVGRAAPPDGDLRGARAAAASRRSEP